MSDGGSPGSSSSQIISDEEVFSTDPTSSVPSQFQYSVHLVDNQPITAEYTSPASETNNPSTLDIVNEMKKELGELGESMLRHQDVMEVLRARVAGKAERKYLDRAIEALREEDSELELTVKRRITSLASELAKIETRVGQIEAQWSSILLSKMETLDPWVTLDYRPNNRVPLEFPSDVEVSDPPLKYEEDVKVEMPGKYIRCYSP